MDSNQFDELARTLGSMRTRRGAIRTAIAGLVGAAGAAAAIPDVLGKKKKRGKKKPDTKAQERCTDAQKKRGCVNCRGVGKPCNNSPGKNCCIEGLQCLGDNASGGSAGRCGTCPANQTLCPGVNGAADTCCTRNQQCVGGVCTPAAVCNAQTCPNGCCAGTTCVAYASQGSGQCGAGGAACAACPQGQDCIQGVCTPAAVCNSETCPSGCCAGTTCIALINQDADQCGTDGEACAACPEGQDCIQGICAPLTVCDAETCSNGCCEGTTCVRYAAQDDEQCGTEGEECAACPEGQDCALGICTPQVVCTSQNCANGCCQNGTCVPFSEQGAGVCGSNGGTCAACPAGQECIQGACTPQVTCARRNEDCTNVDCCNTGDTCVPVGKNGHVCQPVTPPPIKCAHVGRNLIPGQRCCPRLHKEKGKCVINRWDHCDPSNRGRSSFCERGTRCAGGRLSPHKTPVCVPNKKRRGRGSERTLTS
jgi:hypothetical protein